MERALVCVTVDKATGDRIDWLMRAYELTQEQVLDAMAANVIGMHETRDDRALAYWRSVSDHCKRERDGARFVLVRNGA
jgi:hypothetical protein